MGNRVTRAAIRYLYEKHPDAFTEDITASLFHRLYYRKADTWMKNSFLGVGIAQSPFDMYLYQQVIARVRPKFILQTGVANGGSALYFATLLDVIGADADCKCIGVDIALSESVRALKHDRIRLIEGDSTSPDVLSQVRALAGGRKGMVSLDSDHSKAHVLNEIRTYKDFVDVGAYLVVEDTNIGSHGVCHGFGSGPKDALDDFLRENDEFVVDNDLWQRNLVSFHQFGWLKRTR